MTEDLRTKIQEMVERQRLESEAYYLRRLFGLESCVSQVEVREVLGVAKRIRDVVQVESYLATACQELLIHLRKIPEDQRSSGIADAMGYAQRVLDLRLKLKGE